MGFYQKKIISSEQRKNKEDLIAANQKSTEAASRFARAILLLTPEEYRIMNDLKACAASESGNQCAEVILALIKLMLLFVLVYIIFKAVAALPISIAIIIGAIVIALAMS